MGEKLLDGVSVVKSLFRDSVWEGGSLRSREFGNLGCIEEISQGLFPGMSESRRE